MTVHRNHLLVLGISSLLMLPLASARAATAGGANRNGNRGTAPRGARTPAQPKVNTALNADRAQVSADEMALNTATNTYATDMTAFTTEYLKKPEYVVAQQAVDDASAALEAARLAALAQLKTSSPEYTVAVLKEADAQKKLDQMRDKGAASDQISTQAQVILDAGDAASKMEAAALDKDAHYQDCKTKLATASDALNKLKDAMRDAMAADPALSKDKSAVDTAKTNLTAAQTKLAAAGG